MSTLKKILDKKSQVPLYEQVAKILKDRILKGEFAKGQLMPSENILSGEYDISRMTARAALKLLENEKIVACDGTRGRVLKQGNTGVKEPPRRDLFTGLYPFRAYHYDTSYFSEVLEGLSAGALKNHIRLKYVIKENVIQEKGSLGKYLEENSINSLIRLRTNDLNFDEIKDLERKGIKIVLFNIEPDTEQFNFVTCDHYGGTSMLMDCLCNMGNRKIASVMLNRNIDPFVNHARWQAYKDAHDRYKIELNEDYIVEIKSFDGPNTFDNELKTKLEKVFSREIPPSALFISRGIFVEKTLRFLFEMGLNVPDDVSVVSFDSMPLPPGMPRLTCVKQPVRKMAEAALDILSGSLMNKQSGYVGIKFDTEFIPGNSCAFLKKGN
jgi:DNA-binding LacI/PurR family transcriptional regulator